MDPNILESINKEHGPKTTQPTTHPTTDSAEQQQITSHTNSWQKIVKSYPGKASIGTPIFPVREPLQKGAAYSTTQPFFAQKEAPRSRKRVASLSDSDCEEEKSDNDEKKKRKQKPKKKAKEGPCRNEEEEEEGDVVEVVEVVQRRVPTLQLRQNSKNLMKVIAAIRDQPHKVAAVDAMGFGGLLHLDLPRNDKNFVGELIWNFNSNSKCILLLRHKEIKVEEVDVHLVLGLPLGGNEVSEKVDGDDLFDQIMADLRVYYGGVTPTIPDIVKKLVQEDVPVDDNWRRSFLSTQQ